MAGGRNDSKQNGNLNKTYQKLCYNCLDSFATSESFLSNELKEQKGAKQHRTIVNSISQSQDTILR